MNTPPLIDPEFRDYIAPLTPEEYTGLEASLLSEGCRDPLVVWTEENTLIDGHHRYRLCEKHNIPYQLVYRSFASRYHVTLWMIENQLGRRNLSSMQASYLRGKRYQAEKKQIGENQHTINRGDQNDPPSKTAEKLAGEYKVSPPTIKRDEKLVEAIDSLGDDIGRGVLTGNLDITKKDVIRLASLPPATAAKVAHKIASGKADTVSEALGKKPHVMNNSGDQEWYTPPAYIEAARATMGTIDLDPATTEQANQSVRAATIFTAQDNGLSHEWGGAVWLNPPYANSLIDQFADHLVKEYQRGSVTQACVLVNNATDTVWFHHLLRCAAALCLIKGRIKFIDPSGVVSSTPLQGQIVLYFGSHADQFRAHFEQFGVIIYVH